MVVVVVVRVTGRTAVGVTSVSGWRAKKTFTSAPAGTVVAVGDGEGVPTAPGLVVLPAHAPSTRAIRVRAANGSCRHMRRMGAFGIAASRECGVCVESAAVVGI